MIMADVLKIFLLIVGMMLVFVACWMATQALFPALVERTREKYDHPVKLTIQGISMVIPLTFLIAFCFGRHNPVFQLAGSTIIGAIIVVGLAGSSGFTQRIGLGLPTPNDQGQPWRRVLRGSIVWVLVLLLPFAGWFALLPWTIISGFAAAIVSFKTGRTQTAPANVPVAAANQVPG